MQRIDQLAAEWYSDSGLAERVNRAAADVVTQVEMAVAELPGALGAADPSEPRASVVAMWFAEHLRQPPLTHDTDLYNHVATAVDRLKARLATD